ncbi:MAG: S-layer homology domain-containing protein [Clostridia bacterium]|nr:S-layer homology domain-containing protein [Clostridia bacterium]
MKKLTKFTAFILTMLMTANAASAATVEVSDASKGEVKITVTGRQKGEKINILVAEKGTELSALEADVSKLQHQGSLTSDGDGIDEYVFTLKLPENFVSGDYNVYVSGEAQANDLYYVPFDTIRQKVEAILDMTDKTAIAKELELYKRELSLVNDLYTNADKESIGEKLIAAENSELPIDTTDKVKMVAEFQKRIKQFAALSCFELNKKDVLFLNGKYLYNDIVPFEGIDTDKITVNALYADNMTDTGRNAVISSLFGVEYTTVADLQAQYAKAVILNCITNSVYEGYGFLDDVITEGNAELARLSIDDYLELSDTTNANKGIMNSESSITMSNLEDKINDAVDYKPSTGSSSSKGSTSSAPSGSMVIPGSPSKVTTPVAPEQTDKGFSDVENHWAKEQIEYLTEKEILSGYEDNTFKPDAQVKREEVCKIIAAAFDKTSTADVEYSDVKKTDWFYPYVCALSEAGIVNGISDTEFGAGKPMTREAFAVLVARLLELEETETKKDFTDRASISTWAISAVDSLVDAGIINGFEDGSFKPQEPLTRAQIVKIIYSILNSQEG